MKSITGILKEVIVWGSILLKLQTKHKNDPSMNIYAIGLTELTFKMRQTFEATTC